MGSLVMKGKAHNSMIEGKTMRELNCTFFIKGILSYQEQGRNCKLERQRDERTRGKRKLAVGRPGSWTFQSGATNIQF